MSLHTILRESQGDIPIDEFRASRSYTVVRARQRFFYRALDETGLTLGQIAMSIGSRPPTVIYGAAAHAIRSNLPFPRGATYHWCHIQKLQK